MWMLVPPSLDGCVTGSAIRSPTGPADPSETLPHPRTCAALSRWRERRGARLVRVDENEHCIRLVKQGKADCSLKIGELVSDQSITLCPDGPENLYVVPTKVREHAA